MKYNKIKTTALTFFLTLTLNGCSALVPDSVMRDVLKGAHGKIDDDKDGYINFDEYIKNVAEKDVTKEAKEKGMTEQEYYQWDYNQTDTNLDGKVSLQEFIVFARND